MTGSAARRVERSARWPERASAFLDVQALQNPASAERGIGRYLRELADALERGEPNSVSRYLLNPDWPVPSSAEPALAYGRATFSDRVASGSADVFHVPHAFEPCPIDRLWPPGLRTLPLVVTLHDLAPFRFPNLHMPDPRVRRWYMTRLELVRRSSRILAVSEATAGDAIEILGVGRDRIVVSGEGVSERFRPPEDREKALARALELYPWLRRGYVLYTGGMNPRKNVDGLLAAYASLPQDVREEHQLVVACSLSREERAAVDERLRGLGITDQARFPGFVPDDELVLLYQAAKLFVFPSFYEGFGLPVAEAMACGAPVVAARTSSLPELVQDDDALFDPHDPRAIREMLERCLTDHAFLARLRAAVLDPRFTWENAARRTAEAYASALADPSAARPRRRRVAFVAPVLPDDGEEGTQLLAELATHCDVDAFLYEDVDKVDVPAGVRASPIDAFETAERVRGGYDSVVYRLGNGPEYAASFALLQRRAGVVLADHVRLSSVYAWCAKHRPDVEPRTFQAALRAMYGDRVPERVGRNGSLTAEEADRYGILMTREAIGRAERFLVTSRFAAQLARLEAAPADETKIDVVPLGIPDPTDVPDESSPDTAAVVAFVPPRGRRLIVDAFSDVALAHPSATLTIVAAGLGDWELEPAASRERGLAERIQLENGPDARSRRALIRRAVVAVHLFDGSDGASPVRVTECLAAGVPSVVTASGAARELPDACVVKIDRDASAHELASRMVELLHDPERCARLAAAGLAYARENSYARAAAGIYEAIFAASQGPERATS